MTTTTTHRRSHASARGDSFQNEEEEMAGGAAPSIEAARAYGRLSRPMRIPDQHQPSGYRLARVGEAMPAAAAPTAAAKGGRGSVARVADAAGSSSDAAAAAAAAAVAAAPTTAAEPYAFWSTHLTQLDEFGIGVALYFRQLAFLSLLFLGAGLLYVPTMLYNYKHVNGPDTPALLWGSSLGAERGDLSFMFHGMVDLAVCAFLLVFAVASKKVEDAAAAAIDTAQQTTQDYAVEVLNAPSQVKDPDAYADYFRRYGDVVFVTVAPDNGRLLRLLRRRRELRALLSAKIEGLSLLEAERGGAGPEALMPPQPFVPKRLLYRLGLYSHVSLVAAEYLGVKAQIAAEAAKGPRHLRVKRVYAVFNTEAAQRACLEAHRRGLWARALGCLGLRRRGELRFEGVALRVQEPVEPSEVRYEAFGVRAWERGLRYALSTVLAATSLGASYLLLSLARGRAIYTAAVTSGMNIVLPLFMKSVVSLFEVHIDQSDAQDSVLQKLVVARIFAVVVIKYIVTDYLMVMAAPTLGAVASILIADAFTNPVLSILNLPGRFRQWVLAPRARSQREMNLAFAGADWSLAERYTDLIKTCFLSLFWSSILPSSCFLTALAFFIVSFTDKYNLLYQWKRPPLLDSTLARRARNFLVVGVAVHVVMARVFFANWPYANKTERARCNFLMCTYRDWFTPPQAKTVAVFTILGFAALALVVLIYGSFALDSCLRACCPRGKRRRHRRVGPDNGDNNDDNNNNDTTVATATSTLSTIPFRALVGAEPYLPLVHSALFPEPFFAFDVATVPPRFLPVCAAHHPHAAAINTHQEGGGRQESVRGLAGLSLCSHRDLPTAPDAAARAGLFAAVRYYPPPPSMVGTAAGAGKGGSGGSSGGGSPTVLRVPNPAPVTPGRNRILQVLTPAQLQQPEVAVSLAVSKPLPPGWVAMVDPADGRACYYHEPTGTVRWEDPTSAQQQQEGAAAAMALQQDEREEDDGAGVA